MAPFINDDIFLWLANDMHSPMEGWTFPIEYKWSPIDKSTESIESQKFREPSTTTCFFKVSLMKCNSPM